MEDDVRYVWVKDRVFEGLNLGNPAIFEDFLENNELELANFLNQGPKEGDYPYVIHFVKERVCLGK